ncbi:hypothetical protein LCGC14_1145350 [marine sediment metagenome]|uniref:Uncharacterized protein n=1 Tax=marine sediment metagenome TaxID=412755 RepID=A0A0F9MK86_9ZZZZ
MFDEHKSLYRCHLERLGFVSTRAADIDTAIKNLHMSICQIDSSPEQKKALDDLLSASVRSVISEFGMIEELRKKF